MRVGTPREKEGREREGPCGPGRSSAAPAVLRRAGDALGPRLSPEQLPEFRGEPASSEQPPPGAREASPPVPGAPVQLEERLADELARARRYHLPLALALVEVDRLSGPVDPVGIPAADDLPGQAADLLRGFVRKEDWIARYGAAGLALVFPATTAQGAAVAAQRLRLLVEQHPFATRGPGHAPETRALLTAGVAGFPGDAAGREALLAAAEVALHGARSLSAHRLCRFAEVGRAAQEARADAVEFLLRALEARDPYTRAHSEKVAGLAVAMAHVLGLPAETRESLRTAAVLHDIGKMGVPTRLLSKPEPCSPEEWETLRGHPGVGASLLTKVALPDQVAPLVLGHHERYDGRGYPARHTGGHVPLGSRIIAVADAYDAMTSDRPYRKALSPEDALSELHRHAGTQFDPRVVAAFARLASGSVASADQFLPGSANPTVAAAPGVGRHGT